jgi:uncharacterized membrane protein
MRTRYLLVAAGSVAYVVLSHWLMTSAPASPWNAVALLAPMLAAIAHYLWRSHQRVYALCALASIAALSLRAALSGDDSVQSLYLAQHAGIHLCLGGLFGVTLRRGERPLISKLADRVHVHLSPEMTRYTRNLTWAWTSYFAVMAIVSVVLYAWAPFDTWAIFANFATPLALCLMFLGEYGLRYRLHPEFERVSVLDTIRAYSAHRDTDTVASRPTAQPKP